MTRTPVSLPGRRPARHWPNRAGGRASAPRPRARRPRRWPGTWTPAGRVAGSDGRQTHRLQDRRAAGAGHPADRQRHPRPGSGHSAHERRQRRMGTHGGARARRRLSVQLQRGRRGDDRPAQPATSESQNNSWSLVYVGGVRFRRHPQRASRRRHRSHLLLDRAQGRPPDARLYPTRVRTSNRNIRSSTCCTARETAMTRGARSDARGSSWTT